MLFASADLHGGVTVILFLPTELPRRILTALGRLIWPESAFCQGTTMAVAEQRGQERGVFLWQ